MEIGNDVNQIPGGSFPLNQREANPDLGINGFIHPNILDMPNGHLNSDLNNQILPFQPNSSSDLNNQQDNDSEKERQIEEQSIKEEKSNNKGEDSENKKSPKVSKRRSKSEVEGRTFECKLCNKRYLSYPALYTHCKQKHNTNNSSGRGRGRPKKEGVEIETEKNKYNPSNLSYFLKKKEQEKLS